MFFKWNLKKILITTLIALVVASFSFSAIVIYNNKKQNPEVQQTGAATSGNTFAVEGFSITSDIDPTSTNVADWRGDYLRKMLDMDLMGSDFNNWYSFNSTFTISTLEDLVMFALSVGSNNNTIFTTFSGETYKGKTVILANDIDCRGYYIPAIGHSGWYLSSPDSCGPFEGTFDGNGHTISNFKLYDAKEDYGEYVLGLFYKVYNPGKIQDLRVNNAKYYVQQKEGKIVCVGGLVGDAEQGVTIERCQVGNITTNIKIKLKLNTSSTSTGYLTITRYSMSGYSVVGGIVGKLSGYANNAEMKITDCYVHDIKNNLDYALLAQPIGVNINYNPLEFAALQFGTGPAFREQNEGYYVVSKCVVERSSYSGTFSLRLPDGVTYFLENQAISGFSGYSDWDGATSGKSGNYHSTNNFDDNNLGSQYSPLGDLNSMKTMGVGDSYSTWFYLSSFNGGFPCLRQFLPWTTYKFHASRNGSVTHNSIIVPITNLTIDTESSTIVNNQYGYTVSAVANYGNKWLEWQSNGTNEYIAYFTPTEFLVEFCPAVVVYYRYNIATQSYVEDTSREYGSLEALNADSNGVFTITVEEGATFSFEDSEDDQIATFACDGTEVVYNYESIMGYSALLYFDDAPNISDITSFTVDLLTYKYVGYDYGTEAPVDAELVVVDGNKNIRQIRPRIKICEQTLTYEHRVYDSNSNLMSQLLYYNDDGSSVVKTERFEIGIGYPNETYLTWNRLSKYSIGIYIKSSKTDELVKKLYIQRKTNTFGYYIEDLFLCYYVPKEIYHPEKETFYSREESLKLDLNCSCVYVSAYAIEEYQTFTFYTGEGINLTVDRYESTYDYTTEKYTETNELVEENINEYSYGTSGVSKDSDGNVVLEDYVVTNSKMKVEYEYGLLDDFSDLGEQVKKITYYFYEDVYEGVVSIKSFHTYDAYCFLKIVYEIQEGYGNYYFSNLLINNGLYELEEAKERVINEYTDFYAQIATLNTGTITFGSGEIIDGEVLLEEVSLSVNGGALQSSSYPVLVYLGYAQVSVSFNDVTGVLTYTVSGSGISTTIITYKVAPEYYIDDYSLDSADPTIRSYSVEKDFAGLTVQPTFVLKTYGGDFEGDKTQETVE